MADTLSAMPLNDFKTLGPVTQRYHPDQPPARKRVSYRPCSKGSRRVTTCMELTAAGTPFLYFPLKNHFEQNFRVAHRLDRYGAGRRMEFASSTPEMIADAMLAALQAPTGFSPVEAGGAARAARMLAELI